MTVQALLGDTIHDITIAREDGTFRVTVDGKEHQVDARRLDGHFYTMIMDGKSYEVSVECDGDRCTVRHGAAEQTLEFVDPGRVGGVLGEKQDGPASIDAPTRWVQSDLGHPVRFDVERARNPLANGPLAVEQIRLAMQAWTDVPESRVVLALGDTDDDYSVPQGQSPAAAYVGRNAILFGDPYGEIPAPHECAGVIAIGGYWRSETPSGTVNGVEFYAAAQAYVIFNDGFECFLGTAQNHQPVFLCRICRFGGSGDGT